MLPAGWLPSPVNGSGHCATLPTGWLPSPVYRRGWGVRRGIRGACFAPGERHTAVAVCAPCKGGRANNCRQCHTVTKCSIDSPSPDRLIAGAMAAIESGKLTRRYELSRKSSTCFQYLGIVVAALTLIASLACCATPGVTKATGRVTDPPIELVFYCLLFPRDPACRSIVR